MPIKPATQFLRWWGEQYKHRFGRIYVASFAKDTMLIKKLLSQLTIEEAQSRATDYLDDHSEYLVSRGHTIGLFYSKVNEYPRSSRADRRSITNDDLARTRARLGLN